jgi:Holliday junction resolvasome RuvABC endonuclease subunit
MKVLSLDPGAKRCGWAVLAGNGVDAPHYLDSGIHGLETYTRESYHAYRLRLIEDFSMWTVKTLSEHEPDIVVSEILPVKGFSDMSQALLAATAITSVQTIASNQRYPVAQIAAVTVKCQIGGSQRATKVKVRNGVVHFLPHVKDFASHWTKLFDEPDAIGVGLAYMGYDIRP